MNTLTASDIRMILLELDCAVAHRLHADTHGKCIASVREALLRAALADIEVEPLKEAA
jgi:hypothetical protein